MAVRLHLAEDVQMYKVMLGNSFIHANIAGKHREGNVYFPKYSFSLSQSSVGIMGKSEASGKITLYVICQG